MATSKSAPEVLYNKTSDTSPSVSNSSEYVYVLWIIGIIILAYFTCIMLHMWAEGLDSMVHVTRPG